MSKDKDVGIGHNSKVPTDYESSYFKLERAYNRLKDRLCDSISLSMDLQKDDLEDVRVSTRVADRFKNLEVATMHNEHVRDTIEALKRVAYPKHAVSKFDADRLRKELGDDVADVELAKQGCVWFLKEDDNE